MALKLIPIDQTHGWVRPHPAGLKARCGGPAICSQCQQEAAAIARCDVLQNHDAMRVTLILDNFDARFMEKLADGAGCEPHAILRCLWDAFKANAIKEAVEDAAKGK